MGWETISEMLPPATMLWFMAELVSAKYIMDKGNNGFFSSLADRAL